MRPPPSLWISVCCLTSVGFALPAAAQVAPAPSSPPPAATADASRSEQPIPRAPTAAFEPLPPETPEPPPKSAVTNAPAAPSPAPSPAAAAPPAAAPPPAAVAPAVPAVAPAAVPVRTPPAAPIAAPPVATAPAPAPAGYGAPSKTYDHSGDDPSGLLGPFRLGVLVGGGLPELLTFGGQLKITRYLGFGVNLGLIPTVKISYYGDATVSYKKYDFYGRVYPFGGSFFIGAGVGYATIRGTLATDYTAPANIVALAQMYDRNYKNPLNIQAEGSVRTLVLTPQIGFLHIFESGFALGIDLGAQLPIAPSRVETSTTLRPVLPAQIQSVIQTQYINPNEAKVQDTLERVGRTPLPTIGVKLGWFL